MRRFPRVLWSFRPLRIARLLSGPLGAVRSTVGRTSLWTAYLIALVGVLVELARYGGAWAWSGWLTLLLAQPAFLVALLLHELGHAASVTHVRAVVPRMGIALASPRAPYAFTDISMLRDRPLRERIDVLLAGNDAMAAGFAVVYAVVLALPTDSAARGTLLAVALATAFGCVCLSAPQGGSDLAKVSALQRAAGRRGAERRAWIVWSVAFAVHLVGVVLVGRACLLAAGDGRW